MKNKQIDIIKGKKFVLDYERRMSFQKIRLFDYAIQFDIPQLLNVDLGPQLYRVKDGIITHWVEHDIESKFDKAAIEFFKDPQNKEKIENLIKYIGNSLATLREFSITIPDYSTASDEFLLSEYKEFCTIERETSLMNQLLFLYFEKALTQSLNTVIGAEELEILSLQTEKIPLDVYYLDICGYLLKEITKDELYKKYAHFGMVDVNDTPLTKEKLNQDCTMIQAKNPESVKKSIEDKYQENKIKVSKVLSNVDRSTHVYTVLNYFHTYSNKKEWKNFIREMSSYKLSTLLSEIADRRSITLQELSYLTEDEISKIITETIQPEDMRQRIVDSLYFIHHELFHVIEDSALLYETDAHLSYSNLDLTGTIACPGKASGRVCMILSNKDFHKFKDGDVIVAPTTRPDYVPYMAKSSAIVTNEGGMLSHAAILSREIGKPCVIGTKVATTILKDGDMIEVDADEGVIKIVK